ncbi:hypothetical protein [Methylobacterium sp. Leaf113]|uniref:hypothetical protein n=1 Tax=Methylobacterium sp. Leaf113 TaxID=1736259 RepID=UPI0012E95328|nr:hypothetical protein [Methylobacterium sp. Leaf113]
MATDRSKLSLDANPIDIHRATDTGLTQLDDLAEKHPVILFEAKATFPTQSMPHLHAGDRAAIGT